MVMKDKSPVKTILYRYPQLSLKPKESLRKTKEYRDIVDRGIFPSQIDEEILVGSEEDSLTMVNTPAGNVEVLHVCNRNDFIHLVQILAYRGEPVNIPDSIGAITIRGLVNWESKDPKKDTLIITGMTGYSGLNYLQIEKYLPVIESEEKWINMSELIRTYHELTHFVCRNLYIENKEAVRDEIIADAIGLLKAVNKYDTSLAKLFLGIEEDGYRDGGRLENYIKDSEDINAVCKRATALIELIDEEIERLLNSSYGIFEIIDYLEKKRVGIE